MGSKEIIIDPKVAKKLGLDPTAQRTMDIEEKLMALDVDTAGKIQGARPIKSGANQKLPANSAFIKIEGLPLIIVPEGPDIIYIVDKVGS